MRVLLKDESTEGWGVRGELTNMQTDTTLVEQGCTLKSPWAASRETPISRRGVKKHVSKVIFSLRWVI